MRAGADEADGVGTAWDPRRRSEAVLEVEEEAEDVLVGLRTGIRLRGLAPPPLLLLLLFPVILGVSTSVCASGEVWGILKGVYVSNM